MQKQDHLPQIDALRGLAALVVALVFHQYYLTGDIHDGPLRGLPVFTWLHRYGWTVVDLFFVISGFIMCHVYAGEGRTAPSARRFAMARFARLYPLHLATLLVTAGVLSFGVPAGYMYQAPDTWNFSLNLLMLQQTSLAEGMSFNAPAWSIAIEIYCYAVFWIIIRLAPRWLPWLALAIVVGAVLAALPEGGLSRHVARGFCGFFAGVIAWRWRRSVRARFLPIAVILPLWFLDDVDMMNKGCFLALTLYPALVLLALRTHWLEGPVFAWLGSRSYSIYLIHAPVYWAASHLLYDGHEVASESVGLEMVLVFVVVLVAAHFSYRYLEDPARRWLRGAAGQARAPVLAPA